MTGEHMDDVDSLVHSSPTQHPGPTFGGTWRTRNAAPVNPLETYR